MMRLNKREKIAVSVGGGCLLLFVVLQFLVFPLAEKRSKLIAGATTRQKSVDDMRVMQERYQALSMQSGSIVALLAQRDVNFSLFSFLEKNADDSNVKENIAYMKPSESTENEQFKQSLVEMKLEAISLKQLVSFLEKIESPENLVAVDRISIQENTKEAATLDVTMQLVSIDKAAGVTAQ
jgi:general secretion pathway protein M